MERKTLHSTLVYRHPLMPGAHFKYKNDQNERKALHINFISTPQRKNRPIRQLLAHEIPHLCSYPSDKLITLASWNLVVSLCFDQNLLSFTLSDRKAGIFLRNCNFVIDFLRFKKKKRHFEIKSVRSSSFNYVLTFQHPSPWMFAWDSLDRSNLGKSIESWHFRCLQRATNRFHCTVTQKNRQK